MERRTYRIYTRLVYAILWGMVWTYPVLVEAITTVQAGSSYSWTDILHAWRGIVPFFVLFLLHRLPMYLLLLRHRIRSYCLFILLLLVLFATCRYLGMNEPRRLYPPQMHAAAADDTRPPRPASLAPDSGRQPLLPKKELGKMPQGERDKEPHREPESAEPRFQPQYPRPVFFGIPGMLTIDLTIALLMMGFDIAIVLLSRAQEEEEKKRLLETARKEQELEHLKAQLNPHFFMNMLNNIHSMMDIAPRQAQAMIMGLSKLMRYVLYEGAKPLTTLQHEKEFIHNYVELMRKRYPDTKVRIGLQLPPDPLQHISIPPLLFISIIENAFKHGISYCRPSFVEIRISTGEGTVTLECLNSTHPRHSGLTKAEGDIGLANLKQRLELLYGKAFTLETEHTGTAYHVILSIPCHYESPTMPCH